MQWLDGITSDEQVAALRTVSKVQTQTCGVNLSSTSPPAFRPPVQAVLQHRLSSSRWILMGNSGQCSSNKSVLAGPLNCRVSKFCCQSAGSFAGPLWPRGYLVAVDLGPGASYKVVRT